MFFVSVIKQTYYSTESQNEKKHRRHFVELLHIVSTHRFVTHPIWNIHMAFKLGYI